MKTINVIIFFSIVILVYSSINYYILRKASALIPPDSPYRIYFLILFLFVAISYFAGRLLLRFNLPFVSSALTWIGAFWFAFMFYFLLSFLLIDILRLLNLAFKFFPSFITQNYERTKQITAIVLIVSVSAIVITGYINTLTPVIKKIELSIDKKAGDLKSLNIAMASDFHFGTLIGNGRAREIVKQINSLEADIILLPGDILDEGAGALKKQKICEALKGFNAPLGVYAVTGNHEYINGVVTSVEFLEMNGIKILSDSTLLINNSFYLAGREDREMKSWIGKNRKPLEEILSGVDKNLPLILMDHQPFGLSDAEKNNVDLQLSGHTHNGQIWPLNYLNDKIYELSWGYKKKGDTHYYVSCGVGGWGPPIRTGSRPEIVNIKINFRTD